MVQSDASFRALAAFIIEHRDQLEAYAGSDHETAWLAEALLGWDEARAPTEETDQ